MLKNDIEAILETGEQLPANLPKQGMIDTPMTNPVFDGEQIVDQSEE